ncbi:protein FAM104A [Solea solea]|uniref:protein FAM104A n=1 Tax=Solea solea TaxID=90069 RepID=UPI00272C360A|nr:protein FAM104A [Solea solea]
MMTFNRKRRCSCDSEEVQQLSPQAKRLTRGPSPPVSDLDSESSSSDSSNGVGSPERAVVVTTRPSIRNQNNRINEHPRSVESEDSASSVQHGLYGNDSTVSYISINRVLREAHFSSLQSRGRCGST